MPSVESIYFWNEKVETSAEVFAIFKMTAARYPEFESRLRKLHPYDVPEIVRLNIAERLGRVSSLDRRELRAKLRTLRRHPEPRMLGARDLTTAE
mgnify:CR=1 FL=1